MSEKRIPFWLVWCSTGFPPKYKHESRISAENEAARLAKECPGREFYVIMPISKAVQNDVLIERFVDSAFDGLPF